MLRMGIDADSRAKPKLDCQEDGILKFSGRWAARAADPDPDLERGRWSEGDRRAADVAA